MKNTFRILFALFLIFGSLLPNRTLSQEANRALKFDGVNDYINVGNWWNYQEFTVQMWIKPGASQVGYADIIDNNHSSNVRWVCQQMCGTNCYWFGLATVGGAANIAFTLTANVWQHLVLLKRSSQTEVYVNGVLIDTKPCSGTIIGSGVGQDNLFIGNWNGGGRYFNGEMDDIRLWNYALPSSQVYASPYCELSGNETGLVAYYRMNQGVAEGNNTSITTTTDETSNGHHGLLVGFNLTGSSSNFVSSTVTACTNPPQITNNPLSASKCYGGSVTFSVSATGGGLTYQWRKNETNISGATNSRYTIASVTPSDAGSYDVVVSGNTSPAAISSAAILTAQDCPCPSTGLVAYYPFNGNANDESGNGNDGTSNGATLTEDRFNISERAQFFNGSSYINIGDKDALNPHLNDMTVALWVKSSQRRHQRFYSKGTYGGSQSGYALMEYGSTGKVTLIFAAGGHEHAITTNDPILNDGSWHFIAGIINRDGDLELWADGVKQRGDVILGSKSIADHVSADIGTGTGNAGIGAAPVSWGFTEYSIGSIDDIRIYNRQLTSNEVEALYTYTGCTAGVFTYGPTSATRCTGESVTFSVIAVGTGLTYQWRKNGIDITGATGSTLTLSPVSSSDAAVYDVVVSAALPPAVISQAATLTVYTAPSITTQPVASNACTGSPVSLSVIATGAGLSYQWRKNEIEIAGTTSETYTIPSVTPSDAGEYDVVVFGTCSPPQTSGKATLSVTLLPVLDYSGNPNFTASAVAPTSAGPATRFRFEMSYTDAGGNLPQPGEPKLHLDYEGNGIFTNPNDLNLTMYPLDAADIDVTDGKLYFIELPTLPLGMNYKVTYTATSVSGCSASFGPVDGPSVITAANLAIYANDISFSNPHPDPSSLITVTAVIRNLTPTPAANFYVRLVNQAFPSTSYPDILVPSLSGNSTTIVSWAITTPNVASWNPMQVLIDPTNAVTETNEYDNQAIRPFVNGNFAVAGNIAITAAAVPGSVCPAPYTYVTVCGNAQYTNTTVQLQDPSTAGATVTIHVEETDQNFSGNTNASGSYCIQVPAPITPGLYHLLVSVTDYTIDGSTTTQFTVLPPCVVNNNVGGPDLVSSVDVNATEIFVGGSISGSVTITNVGNQAADASTASFAAPNATPSTALTFSTPALASGFHSTSSFGPTTFNTPGYYSVYAMANKDFTAYEINYNNNASSRTIRVCPNSPDLAAGYRDPLQVYQCASLEMMIGNGTCLPVNQSFVATLRVLQNSSVIGTYQQMVTQTVPRDGFITLSYTNIFPAGGNYQVEFTVDDGSVIVETNESNNSYTNSFTVLDCRPDLRVTVPCTPVATTDPQYPGTISVTAWLTNAGNATAQAPFVVDFEVNSSHYPVTITNHLNGGNSVSVPVTLPTPPYGCPVLNIVADATDAVDEINESNNTAQANLYWDFSLSGNCGVYFWGRTQPIGVPISLSVGLSNAGGYRASLVQTRFEVSGPGITGWLDLGMATSTNVGQTCGCPLVVTLPSAFVFLQAGTYQVRMTADATSLYTECNENNNVLVVSVDIGQTPDYRILSQHIAPSLLNPATGQQISIALTYENIGSSGFEPMDLGVKVDETALDQVRVPGLLANTSNAVQFTNQWSSVVPGIHVIRGIVDVNDEISETTKANNQATRALVVGQTADLIFAQFVASNHSPALNTPITIQIVIDNTGPIDCSAELMVYYVDSNNDEILLSTQPITVLANGSLPVNVPWTVLITHTTLIGRLVNFNIPQASENGKEAQDVIGNVCTATITSSGATSFCEGGSVVLTASDGIAWLWSTNATTRSITVTSTGDYSVTVTDATLCSTTSEAQHVSVFALPTVTISADGPTTFCEGGSVTLTATGADSYVWSNSTTAASIVVQASGTYSVTGTDVNGCTATSDAVVVVVNPNVNPGTVNGSSSLCTGTTESFTCDGASGGTWSSSNTAVAIVHPSSGLVTPLAAGTTDITYSITSGCGSPVSSFSTLTVSPNVSAGTVSGAPSLCMGTTEIYTSNGSEGGTWSSSNSAVATVNPSSGLASPVAAGTTDITYTINSGCGSPVTASITVLVSPCQSNCTYTQGYYGHTNRIAVINTFLPITIGKPGRSLTFESNQGSCVASRLPAGGTPVALPSTLGNYSVGTSSCPTNTIIPLMSQNRFNNVLLGQTIALTLNTRNNINLLSFVLPSSFCTRRDEQSAISGPYIIPSTVLSALSNLSLPQTVGGLLELANGALAGQGTGGATFSAINSAVSAINEGFDECRTLVSCAVPKEPDRIIGRDIFLSQNFPNPFNPTTSITYGIPEAGFVHLRVFDVHGRIVSELVNGEKQAGTYSVEFDGSELPSGVYLYRLEAGGQIRTNTMTLVK